MCVVYKFYGGLDTQEVSWFCGKLDVCDVSSEEFRTRLQFKLNRKRVCVCEQVMLKNKDTAHYN